MSEEEVFVATSFVSLETMGQLHTLERRTSSPQTKRRWSEPQITPRHISKRRFGTHHPSSDVRNRGLDHLRADGTARDPDRQPTPDGGSPGQRSVVSFCLSRATEAQHPFHSKRREPFSRHQRSHHLFRQVLQFSLARFLLKLFSNPCRVDFKKNPRRLIKKRQECES